MKNYTEEEIKQLESKADQFDNISDAIHEFYDEELHPDCDLIVIGEWIASYFNMM